MKLLTTNEASSYLSEKGIALSIDANWLNEGRKKISIAYPKVQDINYLSMYLGDLFKYSNWTILQLTGWNIFPSGEDTNLIYSYREFMCGNDEIHIKPGHLFLKHETPRLASLITICCLNLYDGIIISNDDVCRISITNDEIMNVFTSDDNVIDFLEDYKIKKG